MKLKEGVKLDGVQWQMFQAAVIIEGVFEKYGHECIITSGTDGKHSAGSLHYHGEALDFRTFHVPIAQMPKISREIASELGNDYDVVQEGDHLHVEYDPA